MSCRAALFIVCPNGKTMNLVRRALYLAICLGALATAIVMLAGAARAHAFLL
ncbi:MAG: hypothetical protein KA105_08545 [Caulobacter sp.]|jgi:hypothetical protein|nr:hypothetical protein [Caulobacter sp.]